jgi:hypothetical protein
VRHTVRLVSPGLTTRGYEVFDPSGVEGSSDNLLRVEAIETPSPGSLLRRGRNTALGGWTTPEASKMR